MISPDDKYFNDQYTLDGYLDSAGWGWKDSNGLRYSNVGRVFLNIDLTWEDIKRIDDLCVKAFKEALEQGGEVDPKEVYSRVLESFKSFRRFHGQSSSTSPKESEEDNNNDVATTIGGF